MSETWGDSEIATLRAHVQHIADENGALRARAERAEAEAHRLKGLLLSETLCTMHYCERHEMAYQRPEYAQSGCPHCEAERAEAEVARLREVLRGLASALRCAECWTLAEAIERDVLHEARAALADSEKEET